jgi:hypothetical protein
VWGPSKARRQISPVRSNTTGRVDCVAVGWRSVGTAAAHASANGTRGEHEPEDRQVVASGGSFRLDCCGRDRSLSGSSAGFGGRRAVAVVHVSLKRRPSSEVGRRSSVSGVICRRLAGTGSESHETGAIRPDRRSGGLSGRFGTAASVWPRSGRPRSSPLRAGGTARRRAGGRGRGRRCRCCRGPLRASPSGWQR